ncbi:uncharacterized protein [Drosophila takahashii]|uniref:uncharacterized protein n=1 Tax=Drosophila takahashii TaxID=29030 RepID=UPI003898ECCF
MNSIPGSIPLLSFLVILGACLAWSLPMNPDQQDREPVGQQYNGVAKSESFVGRVAAKNQNINDHTAEDRALFDIVELRNDLEAAGVVSGDKRELHQLTYTELVRLLALWHLSQTRNVYEARGPEEQPDQALDTETR